MPSSRPDHHTPSASCGAENREHTLEIALWRELLRLQPAKAWAADLGCDVTVVLRMARGQQGLCLRYLRRVRWALGLLGQDVDAILHPYTHGDDAVEDVGGAKVDAPRRLTVRHAALHAEFVAAMTELEDGIGDDAERNALADIAVESKAFARDIDSYVKVYDRARAITAPLRTAGAK